MSLTQEKIEELRQEEMDEYHDCMDSFYEDWYSDNKDDLISEFIDLYNEEFKAYCSDAFKEFKDQCRDD